MTHTVTPTKEIIKCLVSERSLRDKSSLDIFRKINSEKFQPCWQTASAVTGPSSHQLPLVDNCWLIAVAFEATARQYHNAHTRFFPSKQPRTKLAVTRILFCERIFAVTIPTISMHLEET
jgi:hypothetical protein